MKILSLTDEEVLDYHNPNLQDIVTQVDPNKLEELLVGANYDWKNQISGGRLQERIWGWVQRFKDSEIKCSEFKV